MTSPAVTPSVAWITGAGGLIGNHLTQAAPSLAPDWTIVPLTRNELDLADCNAVHHRFKQDQPSLVFHCAGLTRNGACQADPALAHELNVALTQHLCRLAEGIPLFFLSTDLVFDGKKGRYAESDAVHPLSVYSETKVLAEQHVLQNPRHTVLRTSLNTGVSPTGDRSFTELMRLAWTRGETLTLFTDEFRSPIPAAVTAQALWELVGTNRPGLYHLGGSERLSRWEIGAILTRRWPEFRTQMQPGSVADFTGPPRPADTSLDSSKLQALLSFPLPGLTQWEEEHRNEPI